MAQPVVDPNLIAAATPNFDFISKGVRDGGEFIMAQKKLDQEKELAQIRADELQQQRELNSMQKTLSIFQSLEKATGQLGQTRKAYVESAQQQAKLFGVYDKFDPTFWTYFSDNANDDKAKQAIGAMNKAMAAGKFDEAREILGMMSTTVDANTLDRFSQAVLEREKNWNTEKNQAATQAVNAREVAVKEDNLARQKNADAADEAFRRDRLAQEKELDRLRRIADAKDRSLKLSPTAKAFKDPLQALELKFDNAESTLRTALNNFKKLPNKATRQQLAVAMARAGGDTGVLSNMDIGNMNLSSLGQTIQSATSWLMNAPDKSVDRTVQRALVSMGENVLSQSAARKGKMLSSTLETQASAYPELLNVNGKKHPVVQNYEGRTGFNIVQDPSGKIVLQPRAAKGSGPSRDAKELGLIQAAIKQGVSLGAINKQLGLKKRKPMTQAEYDALQKGGQ